MTWSLRKSKKKYNCHIHATSVPRPCYVHVALKEAPLSFICANATRVQCQNGTHNILSTSVQIEMLRSYVYTASATSL